MGKKKGLHVKRKSSFRMWAEVIIEAVVLALLVRALVIQSYHIPSESMEDTLLKGDFLFANKFVYGAKIPFIDARLPKVRDPKPGDVVIFKFPRDPKQNYIKRCVAVEGQTVEVKGKKLFVDGVEKKENYTKYIYGGRMNFGPYRVPRGYIFVMGDNRDNSYDSRYWGPLDKRLLRGEAMFIYFSIDWRRHRIRFNRIGKIIH